MLIPDSAHPDTVMINPDRSESPIHDGVQTPALAASEDRKVARLSGESVRLGAMGGWAIILLVMAVSCVVTVLAAQRALLTHTIVTAEGDAVSRLLSRPMPRNASADAYEAFSEWVLEADPLASDLAALASERVLEQDDKRPFVWARLAYALSRGLDSDTPLPNRALEALERSMELCPVCSPPLVRWRFNFVLAHWRSIPEEMRRQAFLDAEFLRRSGSDAEFFADLRTIARREGIPFDAYREAAAASLSASGRRSDRGQSQRTG